MRIEPQESVDPGVLLDRMTDAFLGLDDEGRLTYLNERAREIVCAAAETEYTVEELRGRALWDIVPEADETELYRRHSEAIGRQEQISYESYYPPLDAWFHVRLYPSQSGLSVYVHDVTERREQEERLREQKERLEAVAATLSHDLRNPLTVATARLELAQETDGDATEHFEAAERAHERIDALLSDVIDVVRAGSDPEQCEPTDLAGLVHDAWETVPTADADLVVETGRTVEADGCQLRRLLENLLRNAVEHGGEAVTVTVGDTDRGFYVADDGDGPPTDCDQLFEMGYSGGDGTGYGLAIVRGIARSHGWEVAAHAK
ncbi:PAS domain-containing sensor histidine kinase [Halobacteriales archaeon QS_9_67_17]|nr:MAG: PAS domain-containing sensor histidine kinase [Halobacteriales archaeon QS_9_67_17]